jgi:hypothetical protein
MSKKALALWLALLLALLIFNIINGDTLPLLDWDN